MLLLPFVFIPGGERGGEGGGGVNGSKKVHPLMQFELLIRSRHPLQHTKHFNKH